MRTGATNAARTDRSVQQIPNENRAPVGKIVTAEMDSLKVLNR